jgi:CheY-like chemotaxis protein
MAVILRAPRRRATSEDLEATSTMRDDRPGTPAAERVSPTKVGASAVPIGLGTVVVVDEDRREVQRIGRILGEVGHPVIAATDGRAALRSVFGSNVEPALLVSAIEMTTMSGIELAARLSLARPGLRVLLMSSDPHAVDRARSHEAMVHGVLLQPFSRDELRDAVATALAGLDAADPAP